MTLQPTPLLEVKIHLNQPATETLFIPGEPSRTDQSSIARPVVNNPVVSADLAKPTIPKPVVVATSTVPASVPNSAPAVVVGPVVSAPVVIGPVVIPLAVTTPVPGAPVISAPVVPVPVVPVPVVAAPVVPASAPVSAQLTGTGADAFAPRRQNAEPGGSNPGDADTGPETSANDHTAPRIIGNQEPLVFTRQEKPSPGIAQLPAHYAASGLAGAVPVPPTTAAAPMTTKETRLEPQAGSAALREEPLPDQTKTPQPLRSLALEFAPDGAGDIKVRLSERAGDVHISLHGTDPQLAGRVREGVDDLVGSLSRAGYDAETWTPGQGRQNQRQESDQRKPSGSATSGADAEEFSGILQQPIQEIS